MRESFKHFIPEGFGLQSRLSLNIVRAFLFSAFLDQLLLYPFNSLNIQKVERHTSNRCWKLLPLAFLISREKELKESSLFFSYY